MHRQIFGHRVKRSAILGLLATLAMAVLVVTVPQTAQAALSNPPPMSKCRTDRSYAEVPGFDAHVFDDSSVRSQGGHIDYSGTWDALNDAYDGAIGNTLHVTDAGPNDTPADNWATLYFYGNAVSFYYRTVPGGGAMGVYFDEKLQAPAYSVAQSSYDGGRYYKHIDYCDNVNGARWHSIHLYSHNPEAGEYKTNLDAFQIHQFVY